MNAIIIGLGRIGLPLALVSADSGINITGIDIKKTVINQLKNKQTPFHEPHMDQLLNKHLNKIFFPKLPQDATDDIKNTDYIIFTIGTMYVKYPKKPNLERIYNLLRQITTLGIHNKTIIFRVTLPIGSTDTIKKTIEQQTNLTEGKDFYLAFVPERIMEGKAIQEERTLPKIIGCYSETSYEKTKTYFNKIGGKLIKVSNPKTAEFIKLIDNAWRNTRFAFANELAFLAETHKINVYEAIQRANQGYQRNQIPQPGPVSGYCLGKDPYILEGAFETIHKQRGFNSLWYYGRAANDWFFKKITEEIQGTKILIAGLSFKVDIDDFRYSHGIEITKQLLEKKQYQIYVHDPHLDKNIYTTLPQELEQKITKINNIQNHIDKIDTIIIATPHKEYKALEIETWPQTLTILDLWNLYSEKNICANYKPFGKGDSKL